MASRSRRRADSCAAVGRKIRSLQHLVLSTGSTLASRPCAVCDGAPTVFDHLAASSRKRSQGACGLQPVPARRAPALQAEPRGPARIPEEPASPERLCSGNKWLHDPKCPWTPNVDRHFAIPTSRTSTGRSSHRTTRPTTRRCAPCAAAENAPSPADRPLTSAALHHRHSPAESATTPKPHSYSPILKESSDAFPVETTSVSPDDQTYPYLCRRHHGMDRLVQQQATPPHPWLHPAERVRSRLLRSTGRAPDWRRHQHEAGNEPETVQLPEGTSGGPRVSSRQVSE